MPDGSTLFRLEAARAPNSDTCADNPFYGIARLNEPAQMLHNEFP